MAFDRALLVEGTHGAPGAVVVAVGLVDQVQVEVVEAQTPQRGVERLLGVLLAGVLYPQLGGDEQLPVGDAAGGDGAADGFLVAVGGSGVEVAVAGGQGACDGLLGLFGGIWKTPKPRIGISTPLLRVTVGT